MGDGAGPFGRPWNMRIEPDILASQQLVHARTWNWLDARTEFCWMRARARAACRQPTRLLISRARWLLNARPVAKTDALIVYLSEFWV